MHVGDDVLIVLSAQVARITWIDWEVRDGKAYPEAIWVEKRFNDGSQPYRSDELELLETNP